MADRLGFNDYNPALMINKRGRLAMFWLTVVSNSMETCLMNTKVASEYSGPGAPQWQREGLILLKPDDFGSEALKLLGNRRLRPRVARGGPEAAQRRSSPTPLYQRLGWGSRCKPTVPPSGRILLPLYTDTFSISIMAVSDDGGETWYASKPLIGFGNIQPTVLRRDDGTLVAYMRENGPRRRIRVSGVEGRRPDVGAPSPIPSCPTPAVVSTGCGWPTATGCSFTMIRRTPAPAWPSRSPKTRAGAGRRRDTSRSTPPAATSTPALSKLKTGRSTPFTVASSPPSPTPR